MTKLEIWKKPDEAMLNIADVERETGLSKDTLRVWERRYGFPVPQRDAAGMRVYPPEQVARLRQARRLIDQGQRPGKVFEALRELPLETAEPQVGGDAEIDAVISASKAHDQGAVRQALAQLLARRGLQGFVIDTLPPLLVAIGEAWSRGEMAVLEEHLITEAVQTQLRAALNALPAQRAAHPVVMLTTLPEEQHGLGLLMAQALLESEGATCLPLGPQMPLTEIAAACEDTLVDVVALSVSAAYPTRQAVTALRRLRELLPGKIAIWAGGAGVRRHARSLAGIEVIDSIGATLPMLAHWREQAAARGAVIPSRAP